MAIFDDFLRQSGLRARLDEHAAWQEQQRRDALTGPLAAIPATLKVGASGLGLLLEGSGNLGKLASGGVFAGVGQLAPGLSNLTDAAYNEYARQGGMTQQVEDSPAYTLAAMMAAHEAAAGQNKYLTGAVDMLTDPTNLVPVGPAERLGQRAAERTLARETAGAALSPEFARAAADEIAQKAADSNIASPFEEGIANAALRFANSPDKTIRAFDKAALKANPVLGPRVPTAGDKKAATAFGEALDTAENINDAQANIAAYLTRRQRSLKGETIEELGGQYGDVLARRKDAQATRDAAEVMFRENKAAQKQYLKETQAIRDTSIEGADDTRAKVWFEEIFADKTGGTPGVDFPAAGQSYHGFMDGFDQSYRKLRAAEDKLSSRLREAMAAPEVADLPPGSYEDALKGDPELQEILRLSESRNPADRQAWQKIVAESDSNELSRLNGRFNEEELGSTPPYTPDEFAASGLEGGIVPPQPQTPRLESSIGELVPELARYKPDNPAIAAAQAAPADTPQAAKAAMQAVVEAKPLAPAETATEAAAPFGADEATGRTWDLVKVAFQQAKKSQMEAFNRDRAGVIKTAQALPGMWAGITTQTVRNILQDEAFVRLLLSHNKLGQGYYNKSRAMVISRLMEGETNEARLFGNFSIAGEMNGWPELAAETVTPEMNAALHKKMGGSAWELEADNAAQLNALEQLAANTLLGVANPTRAVTNLALMPLGLLSEGRSRMFHIINNVTHMASRAEAAKSAYLPFINNSAETLLRQAEAEGLNTATLRGRQFVDYDGAVRAAEGMFSPQEVTQLLGQRYGEEWARMVNQARDAGFAESSRVFGNFANKGPVEKKVASFLPFMSWAWRAYPRVAEMVFSHPAVAAGIYQLYRMDSQQARREGRKSYQYGTLAINNETPLVGLIASVFTPDQEAEIRFNPASFFSPVGGEQLSMLSGAEKEGSGEKDNIYQQANELLGAIGASPNPLIQATAYELGWDYKTPGPLSRYSPVDMAVDNVAPFLSFANVPTTQAPMRAVRDLVRETLGRGGTPDHYDPIERRANELVFERTGKPVSDKSNNQLASQIRNHTGIYNEAEAAIDIGGARRAIFNASSPISVQTNTATGEEIRKARAGTPFTYADVVAAQRAGNLELARLLQQAIVAQKQAHPAAAAQDRPAYFR